MTVTENDMKTALAVESTYSSFMRNCIILFTLGLTIINLTKKRKTEKYMLSFIVIISGILIGIISTIEYKQRIEVIKNKNFENYNLMTNTVYITGFLTVLFVLIMVYKFINTSDEHNLFSRLK